MFLRKKIQIAFWCELEPEIHVKLEQKRKPPIVMTKHMQASGRQTQTLLGRAYCTIVTKKLEHYIIKLHSHQILHTSIITLYVFAKQSTLTSNDTHLNHTLTSIMVP